MPWRERDTMDLRREFVELAGQDGFEMRELCRRFGISPTTGYKWLRRFEREGVVGLRDRSRRPQTSPLRTLAAVEERVLSIRGDHEAWGGRKIRRRLQDLGMSKPPAASTITAIVRRHGLMRASSESQGAYCRFEAEEPNDLWQMDFKGHFQAGSQRCHPLTVLDDHSRYSLSLEACRDEHRETVCERLRGVFRRYGLPRRMLVDNGPPWGSAGHSRHTRFTVWLMRLDIGVTHSRPYHPQTLGKDERFHKTLKAEVLRNQKFRSFDECQSAFDRWRHVYNFERPHDSLGLEVPATRYQPSRRSYPEILKPIEYPSDVHVRKISDKGLLSFRGRRFRISKAFRRQPVAVRPTTDHGRFDIVFCSTPILTIDLTVQEP